MSEVIRSFAFERMVLASSNIGDTVLDPFVGSGTALRVCQQTNRKCIGIDINPDYIKMSIDRLSEPFNGFDSIDERMKRVPDDLNDDNIRIEYLQNHIKWFLNNHPNSMPEFFEQIRLKYFDKMLYSNQLWFLDYKK